MLVIIITVSFCVTALATLFAYRIGFGKGVEKERSITEAKLDAILIYMKGVEQFGGKK